MACQYALLLLSENDWVGVMGTGVTAPVFPQIAAAPYSGSHKADIDAMFAALLHPPSTTPPSSIAAGVIASRNLLAELAGECSCFPSPGAVVVLTDGTEGTPPAVTSLGSSSIPTYAIGVGSPSGSTPVNVATLANLTGASGYALVCPPKTGLGAADAFAIAKYLIQIVATLRNGGVQVVLDPCGKVSRKKKHEIPFVLTKADRSVTVLIVTHDETALKATLYGPNKKPVERARVRGAEHRLIFRVDRLGRERREKCDGVGRWHIELEHSGSHSVGDALDYSVVVLADSDLEFETHLQPRKIEIGELLFVSARLSEGGAPISAALAHVFAEVTAPDGSTRVVPMRQSSPGSFGTQFPCVIPGVVHVRVLARGRSHSGGVFQREQTLTAHVAPRAGGGCECCRRRQAGAVGDQTHAAIKEGSTIDETAAWPHARSVADDA
jgi:hypothetical protein